MTPKKLTAAIFVSALAASSVALAQGGNANNAQSSNTASQQAGSNAKQKNANGQGPVVVLVPLTFANNPDLSNGCWARLYGDTNYGGDMLTLTGPIMIPENVSSAGGMDFGRNFDSVAVGRNAKLVVYTGENYTDRAATFSAGQKVPDLGNTMGFFQEIESVKLTCSK